MANIKEFFNKDDFTKRDLAKDLYGNSIRKNLTFNVFGKKKVFDAIVLSAPIMLLDADLSSGRAVRREGEESGRMTKFAFKGRILDSPSPHDYLPDPCDAAIAVNPINATRIINLHTTFFSSDDYTRTPGSMPKVGDVVRVQLDKNIFSYNLQYGTFISMKHNSTQATEITGECQSTMVQYFAGVSQQGTGVLPPSGDSGVYADRGVYKPGSPGRTADKSALAACKANGFDTKNPTIPVREGVGSTSYTQKQVIDAILGTTFSNEVKKLLFIFTMIEQPSFDFPGNNPGGIQTDGSKLGYSQITYQFCKWDGQKHRVFAGFDTLTDAFQVKGSMLAGKLKSANYTTMTTDTIAGDLDTLHMNYYRVWNFSASKADYDQIVKYGYFIRSNKVIPSTCKTRSGATNPPAKVLIGKNGCKSPAYFKTRLKGILTSWYKVSGLAEGANRVV